MAESDFITIYTDASYHQDSGKARWAFYAKCSWGVIKDHGDILDREIKSSNEAEMFAICMAIWKCFVKWPELIGFFVNTDSKHCCMVWWPFRKDPWGDTCRQMRDKLQAKLGKRWVRVKHVKGHQRGSNIRTRLNRLVDVMASQRRKEVP